MKLRIATATTLALLWAGAGMGCSSAPDQDEDIGATRDAICSGGGGGDDCVANDGFCPPSCSTCFTSFQQRIEVQNAWNCVPDPGGGGGGGDVCPQNRTFTSRASNPSVPEGSSDEYREGVLATLCDQAQRDARAACSNTMLCTASAGTTEFTERVCVSNGTWCFCKASVPCSYRFW